MLALIRGAGDIATGIALRLHRAGIRVAMLEVAEPTTIRRTVAFSEAVLLGECAVEDITARLVPSADDALGCIERSEIPVLVDPDATCAEALAPDALVDAILAKRNLGTTIGMAPVVIGVGPGFTAGEDCHAVVETMRGHYLGRVYYDGSALPNTGIPGLIGGFAGERVMRAPADGVFRGRVRIGDEVRSGDVCGEVAGLPMRATIDGVIRGLLADGVHVSAGMKAGDVDPRCEPGYIRCVSDKALAVGGGVLEAILALTSALVRQRSRETTLPGRVSQVRQRSRQRSPDNAPGEGVS